MWHYQNTTITELPEDCVGFVYLITCTVNSRMYVGKKLARFKTLRYKMHTQKNGKKFAALCLLTGKNTMVLVIHLI
jgi:predicted GIY-YIG superfamily endonuclease